MTTDIVREALKVCFDPELPVNIVDLGIVYGIYVEQDHDAPGFEPRYIVSIDLVMRTPNEERAALLTMQIKNRLAGMQEISRSEVRIVGEPAWSADRMSGAARRQLGFDPMPKQSLVSIKL